MADISNVINAQLLPEGQLAGYDNINVVAILTSERGILKSNNRYQIYKTSSAVSSDFGAMSKTNDFATSFFGTTPNPISAGGALVIGYWRATSETLPATSATLIGSQVSEATLLGVLQGVTNGSFNITVDGTEQNITGLNFQTATGLSDIVNTIDAALGDNANVTTSNNRIIIKSATTGETSTITALTSADDNYIGSALGLDANSGVSIVQGKAIETLSPETKLEALTRLKSMVNVKGFMFIDKPTDTEAYQLAEYANANSCIGYDVFSDDSNLLVNTDNVVWNIKLAGLTAYRCLFSKSGNRKFAASYMARTHVVNFNGENTALTMHLKTLSIPSEDYTQTQITAAKRVGLDIYTTIKDVSCVLTSDANDFVDNVYNLMSYIDGVQTDAFNLLKGTATKIGQVTHGVNQLIDTLEKTSGRYKRAAFIGAGTWSSPDFFGNYEEFTRSIEAKGYYWLAGSLSEQSQADRQARKSPALQNAIKNYGAIHSADIIINFNY